jgi:hypothetical protein
MSFFQTRFKKEKRWICSHCKRINDKEDEKCAFCREPKPEKWSGKDPNNARIKSSRTDYNGMWFQSKLEANYAKELDFRIKAGEVREWRRQVKIEIKVNGIKICNYFIDFVVTLKDGSQQYVECKGMEQEVWRLKWKLCMALKDEIAPGVEWIVVK